MRSFLMGTLLVATVWANEEPTSRCEAWGYGREDLLECYDSIGEMVDNPSHVCWAELSERPTCCGYCGPWKRNEWVDTCRNLDIIRVTPGCGYEIEANGRRYTYDRDKNFCHEGEVGCDTIRRIRVFATWTPTPPPAPSIDSYGGVGKTCPPDWISAPASLPPKCYRRLVATNLHAECSSQCARELPGATPVCVENADEQEFIASAFRVDSSCCGMNDGDLNLKCCTWIGLFQTVTDRGSDYGWDGWRAPGCTSHFLDWADGEPNDWQRDESCAAYGWEGSHHLVDAPCDAPFHCMCEVNVPSPPPAPEPAPPPSADGADEADEAAEDDAEDEGEKVYATLTLAPPANGNPKGFDPTSIFVGVGITIGAIAILGVAFLVGKRAGGRAINVGAEMTAQLGPPQRQLPTTGYDMRPNEAAIQQPKESGTRTIGIDEHPWLRRGSSDLTEVKEEKEAAATDSTREEEAVELTAEVKVAGEDPPALEDV